MENLIVLGLIYDIVGVLILVLVTMFGVGHQEYPQEKWTRRYGWQGWYLGREPNKIFIRRLRIGSKSGCIHPKHQWNLVGFIYIGIGFSLQIIGNLRG